MEPRWLLLWISVTCLFGGVLPQYRDKNISSKTDAVQGILARYLQKRLQAAQIFSPPPPSVLFNLNRQSRARKSENKSDNEADADLGRIESQEREDYDDYEDDLQGFEDSEFSRTKINLFGKTGEPFLISTY